MRKKVKAIGSKTLVLATVLCALFFLSGCSSGAQETERTSAPAETSELYTTETPIDFWEEQMT